MRGAAVQGAHTAALAGPSERVPHDPARTQRPSPESQPRQVGPPEPPDEDRIRLGVRKGHRERRARCRRGFLVGLLQRREHALAAVAGIRGHVHGDGEPSVDALEPRVEEAHRRDAHDLAVVDREGHDALARRVAVEPPGELLVRELRRPHARQQRDERRTPLGCVPDDLEAHLDAIPRSRVSVRRACVPGTVSFRDSRSQEPVSTSSNVRAEYGSTL